MPKNNLENNSFQSLLKELHEAHNKQVLLLESKVKKLEEEIQSLKAINASSSSLMNNTEEIMSKGRRARDKMKSYVATGKGKPTSKDWEALTEFFEIEHHDFIFALLDCSKGMLSGRDFLVCVLVRDGWEEYDIQILLDLTSERVSNIFRKINSIIFGKDTSKNLIQNILSLDVKERVFKSPSWIP